MTAEEILELVAELRRQQKLYYSPMTSLGNKNKALKTARALEKRVDEALESYSEARSSRNRAVG